MKIMLGTIIVVVETWLTPDIHSSELFDPRYVVFRLDRNLTLSDKATGGGIVFAIKNKFSVTILNKWNILYPLQISNVVCFNVNYMDKQYLSVQHTYRPQLLQTQSWNSHHTSRVAQNSITIES